MDYLNPVAPSVLQSPTAQRQAAINKGEQVRRTQIKRRTLAMPVDETNSAVENAEEISPTRRESADDSRKKKRPRGGYSSRGEEVMDEGEARVDLTG